MIIMSKKSAPVLIKSPMVLVSSMGAGRLIRGLSHMGVERAVISWSVAIHPAWLFNAVEGSLIEWALDLDIELTGGILAIAALVHVVCIGVQLG
jgi:hypothetical protein